LLDLVRATDPLGQVARPVVHQDTPAVEQVGAGKAASTRLPTTCAKAASTTSLGCSVSSAAQSRKLERRPQYPVNVFIM